MFKLQYEKKVLAFYYVWYGTPWGAGGKWRHWDAAGHNPERIINGLRDIASTHYPLDGVYDSLDESTIKRHISQAKEAGIDGFILSWWDGWEWSSDIIRELGRRDDFTQRVLMKCLQLCPKDFSFTIYYETALTFPIRDYDRKLALEKIYTDIKMLLEGAAKSDRWIRIDNRPVFVFYIVKNYTVDEWAQIKEKLRKDGFDPFFIGDTYDVEYLKVMDGLHTYNPIWITRRGLSYEEVFCKISKEIHERKGMYAATVCPGFDKRKVKKDSTFVPREDGHYYSTGWKAAIKSEPEWVLICTWNEWHEGSEIEPSLEYGDDYLYLTKQYASIYKKS